MAGRGRKRVTECYVYAIMHGPTCVYVGKGSSDRSVRSAKKHGGTPVILEQFTCEDQAFKRERELIAEMMPQNNISTGGNGGRLQPKLLTRAQQIMIREAIRFEAELKEVGQRRYCARFLVSRIDESNCDSLGVSRVGLNRLREVANGGWA